MVTGFGRIDGVAVGVIGIDPTILAGTTAPMSMRKQNRLIEQAQRFGGEIRKERGDGFHRRALNPRRGRPWFRARQPSSALPMAIPLCMLPRRTSRAMVAAISL
ncbi:carboxyl transferase domain-containing protein [Chelatococcus sp.]|uniref:carboxyl transferase domain-containing protein n=1 Tax=Chelatococcus sp. TaxID=1953771 RepID=UPI0034424B71